MMATKDIIKKVQKNSKEIANKGSEVVEKAYKTTVDMLQQAKQDGPDLLTNLVKKGENEWEEAKKVIDKLFQDNKEKLVSLQKDIVKALEDLRDRFIKELPVDLTTLQELLKKVEDTVGKIDLPFVKFRLASGDNLPIQGYEKMTVKEILPKLADLEKEQLSAILVYEEQHQKRVSVTREIKKLLN